MADFKDKFSGKLYRAEQFSTLSASVAAASDGVVDGRKHDFFDTASKGNSLKILPYRVKRGDQAKFFPGLSDGSSHAGIETGSIIRDTVRQIVYVPIKKKNYQNNLIGVGSHISTSFASGAYLQISESFAAMFKDVGDDTLLTFGVEELYTSPSASRSNFNVESASNEFRIKSEGTIPATSNSFSTIDSGSDTTHSPNFTLNFDTSFATHWEFYTGAQYGNKTVEAYGWYPTCSVEFPGPNGGDPSSSLLTDEPFISVSSGDCVGIGTTVNVNGANTKDGTYNRYGFRFIIKGDADSGSFYQEQGECELISFPSSALEGHITSSEFRYHASDRDASKTSGKFKTLYYYSGSGIGSKGNGGDSAATLISTYKGLFITSSGVDGSPVFKDANLKLPADEGFYSPDGSATMLVTTSSQNPGFGGPVYVKSPVPLAIG